MTHPSVSRFSWWLSLLLSLLLTPSFVQAQATQAVTVRVTPLTVEVPLGQTIDVAVEVGAVQDLYGFDLALKFDPNVVEVVDADPTEAGVQTALGVFLDSGFVVLNAADNLTGTLRFVMTQLNPSEPKSGTGALIVIRLRGKQVSDGRPLTLTGAQLARRDGTTLPTNLVSGVINVIGSGGSAPVSTPIPTQGAGTPMPAATPLSVPPTAPAVSAPSQPTPTPMMTSPSVTPSATLVPQPTDRSVAIATEMLIESVTPPVPTNQAPNTQSATATPQATAAQPVSTAAVGTNTPVAVAAVSEPTITPGAIRAAIQVTEPAASANSSPESASGLLAVSGVLGLAGLITVWMVTRRRSL